MLSDNCTSKKINLSTLGMKNSLEHIKFPTKSEKAVLTKMHEKCPLTENGHDLDAYFDYANGSLGYLTDRCGETVRVAKEGLQARGIILIDGLTWEQSQIERDGKIVRVRTPQNQRIEFTHEYKVWFKACVTAKKILGDRKWGYCDGYIQKRALSRLRSSLAMARFKESAFSKVFINMGKTCEEVQQKLVTPLTNFLGTFNKTQNSNSIIKYNSRIGYGLHSDEKVSIKEKFINPLIANLSACSNKTVKTWTDATNRIVNQLFQSGMTKVEIIRTMIRQGYVNTVNEFESKYSHPMNC
jgi:hypothetical protein